MDFSVELNKGIEVGFCFNRSECLPVDYIEDEPYKIYGKIKDDRGEILGDFTLYELDNDCDFYYKCDAVSGDSEAIASTICGTRGNVLKKYIPNLSYIDTILILDNITIKEEYRGKGIGSNVVKNLLYMTNYQFDIGKALFLCASDFESAKKYGFDSIEYKNGTDRLINFYKKQGFKVVKDNILVCYK